MSTHNSSPRHREWKLGCKVYIGNLAEGASKSDIEDAFNKYGPLRNVWVARNPPGFAFVEFEDGRDAEDACRHLDGTRIAGGRIKAEMSHGRTRRGRGGGPPSFRGGGGGPPPYPPMNGSGPYGGPMRGGYHGHPPRGVFNGSSDYGGGYHPGGHHHHHQHHHAGYRGGHNHHHGGPPPPMPHMHGGANHHNPYMERPMRGAERHIPRQPRSPLGMKDFRGAYNSRSRSNSLGKSPPPPPMPTRTARPRTPPSRTPSPSHH